MPCHTATRAFNSCLSRVCHTAVGQSTVSARDIQVQPSVAILCGRSKELNCQMFTTEMPCDMPSPRRGSCMEASREVGRSFVVMHIT